jgi:heme oxygenase (biliverdin-producing, ferredoxin)
MTAGTAGDSPPVGIVAALHHRTKALHVEAERSGIIRDLLHETARRAGYIVLLRNLLPAYRALEMGLNAHRFTPGLDELARFQFDRAGAIESDLIALCGPTWSDTLPLLPAGVVYAQRIAAVAQGDGARLIAHAYTRYLGDLSGGMILRRLLSRSLALGDSELSFYDFTGLGDPDALKTDFRLALDHAGTRAGDSAVVVEEGAIAFQLNIDLSWAVRDATSTTPTSAVVSIDEY